MHAALSAFQAYSANLHSLVIERRGGVVAECYRAGKDRSVYSLLNHTLEAFVPRTSGSQIRNPEAAATGQIRPKWIISVMRMRNYLFAVESVNVGKILRNKFIENRRTLRQASFR